MPGTLGTTPASKINLLVDRGISLSFLTTGSVSLTPGTCVTLQSDGTVNRSVAGDVPIGIVEVGNPYDGTQKVTVLTCFKAELLGEAGANTLTIGELVNVTGWDDTVSPDLDIYTGTSGSQPASGMVLAGNTTGLVVTIGVFYSPVSRDDAAALAGSYIVKDIVATSTSTTTDFAVLKVGDRVRHTLVADGTSVVLVVTVAGALPVAAVVGDSYLVTRANN